MQTSLDNYIVSIIYRSYVDSMETVRKVIFYGDLMLKLIWRLSCNLIYLAFSKKKNPDNLKTNFSHEISTKTIALHTVFIKPDFHSRFSLVASENFRMRHAQSGETNKTGRKNIFRSVRIQVQIFQLLRNFLTAKPIRLFP